MLVKTEQEQLLPFVKDVRAVASTLDPKTGDSEQRQTSFQSLLENFQAQEAHPIRQHMAKVMESFKPGLFIGGDDPDLPHDNLDLERWFRLPKGHERRIHGHRHAGTRLVHQGPTGILALDAHCQRSTPFTAAELRPYAKAQPPPCQTNAMHRSRIMRKARSRKQRPALLQMLERRYLDSS